MKSKLLTAISALSICALAAAVLPDYDLKLRAETPLSPETNLQPVQIDSVIPPEDQNIRYSTLSDDDFKIVAKRLDVEVAAIKAVVAVEAGKDMSGFWAPGYPIVNCDKSLWNTCKKWVVNNSKDPASASVPASIPNGFPKRAWQKLINARKINRELADLCTFWGMFQIGGFNFKKCGCKSIQEFVELQSYSELQQLEIFATLIENSDLTKYLKNKNWAGFAAKYNGPSYARKGYHTKMANAYLKYKNS